MREEKAIELMKYFAHELGGEVSDVKLMKLLYFTDRKAIKKTGFPITYDHYFSMNRGPVLSRCLDLINEFSSKDLKKIFATPVPGKSKNGYNIRKFKIKKREEFIAEELSHEEISIAKSVVRKLGKLSDDDIVLFSHSKRNCPEWEFPHGTSIPITLEKILSNLGYEGERLKSQAREIKYHRQSSEI